MLVTLRGLRVNAGLVLIGISRTGPRFCVLLCSLWLCEISINQFNFFFFFSDKSFNVVDVRVLEQSGDKAIAGKKTGSCASVTHTSSSSCSWSSCEKAD